MPQTMPAGSMPPKEEGQATDQKAGDNSQDKAGEQAELLLGKFKSSDDLASGYQNLEADHGRLGKDVGDLRKQNELLMNQMSTLLASQQQGKSGSQSGELSIDDQLANVAKAVKEGDMTIDEGLTQVAELTAQKSVGLAKQHFEESRKQEKQNETYGQFVKTNPDFMEALNAGALDPIKQANPMHDNFSAYYEWKAGQNAALGEQKAQEAYAKGKAETAELAKGATGTKTVLSNPGSNVRTTNNNQKLTQAELEQSMLAALQASRTAAG